MHERMASLPDIPELPQCTCQTVAVSRHIGTPPERALCLVCAAFANIDITREDFELISYAATKLKDRGLLDSSLAERVIQLERELRRSEDRRIEAARCSRVYLDEKRAMRDELVKANGFLEKSEESLKETLALIDQFSDQFNAVVKVLDIIKEHEGIPSIEWGDDERAVLYAAGVIE